MSVVEQKQTDEKMKNSMIASSTVPVSSSIEENSTTTDDFFTAAWKYFIEFNIFSTGSSLDDPFELETQRIATKLFIIILLTSFLILFSYTTSATSIHTFSITTPSIQQYKNLYQKHSRTLKCPCSRISNKYQSFITVEYSRHPVCSSIFVTDEWITYLGLYRGVLWRYDFRFLARQVFQALQSLCQLTEESIEISLEQFYSMYRVTDTVINEELLQSEFEANAKEFFATSMNKFLLSLRIIGDTTKANALLSGLSTNSFLIRGRNSFIESSWASYENCSCFQFNPCLATAAVYKNGSSYFSWILPGFYRGCLILEVLLQSDLRCFFNQTCLDDFQAHLEIETPLSLTQLDSSILHQFDVTSTIETIVDRLMIDEMHWNINHSRYFDNCQPKECTYRAESGDSWVVIIGTLFGLAGGLVTALKLITPRVVWLARWRFQCNTRNSPDASVINRSRALLKKLIRYGLELNLFVSIPSTIDPHQLQTQRISTRVFIVIFLLSSYILFIYTARETSIHSFTIYTPSLETYNQLLQQYSQMLKCPCSQISNKYKSFITIEYSRHPVCSSVYTTDRWINAIQFSEAGVAVIDFRFLGYRMFAALRSFCQLTEEAIKIGLDQFYSGQHITDVVSNEQILRLQADANIEHFIDSTTSNFLLSLRMVSDSSQANALLSHLMTNCWITHSNVSIYLNSIYTAHDNNCSCSFSSACTTNLFVGGMDVWGPVWFVPGLYRGCFVVEALWQSNLRCFFDQYCLAELLTNLQMNQSVLYTVLDSSLLKQFQEDTPIGTVLDGLMVEEWRWNVSHAKYYEMCQPKECTYTIMARNSWISILTVMIGLVGGLVTALRISVPRIAQVIRSQCKAKTHRRAKQNQKHQQHTFKDTLLQYFIEFNVFPSIHSATDMQKLRTERIASKVFVITLFISFIIVLAYTATATVVNSFIIPKPSFQKYNQLNKNYPQTLVCPCSQITNKYQDFINIQYVLHPICSSIYIDDRWIANEWFRMGSLYVTDFRLQGTRMFRALQSFCQVAETSIKTALDEFYARHYVTAVLTHPELFHPESQAIIQEFITTTTNNFLLSLRLIGNTTQVNAIASGIFSNINFKMELTSYDVDSEWMIYDNNCSCAYDSGCSSRAVIYTNGSWWSPWYLPGFYRACFIVEAIRQSDFRCFANETCLEDFRVHLEYDHPISLPTLNLSSSRNFRANTPIGVIMDALMVDEWKWNVSHAQYYAACQSKECNYIVIGKNSLIGLVTTLIGILGGLVKIEQFLIPKMTNFVLVCIQRKRKTTIHPSNTVNLTITSTAVDLKVENIDH